MPGGKQRENLTETDGDDDSAVGESIRRDWTAALGERGRADKTNGMA